tara:strand:+ start:80673 stop:81299 length:627 start_codon:yes stop_codon:yes gene_type:complete
MEKVNNIESINKTKRKLLYAVGGLFSLSVTKTLFAGDLLSISNAAKPNLTEHIGTGKLLSNTQLTLLKQVCAIVLPKTGTLGAAETATNVFVDGHLYDCCDLKTQQKVVGVLNLIEQDALALHGKIFTQLTEQQQFLLLTDLDLGQNSFDQRARSDFKVLKQLICFGYYTSEEGASHELNYVAVPGQFVGSIPCNSKTVSWGSKGLFY